MSAMSAAFSGVTSNPGLTACARFTNSATADDRVARFRLAGRPPGGVVSALHLVHVLAADPQHDAARDEEAGQRRGAVQADEHRRRLDDLLEVVEHDEHPPIAERMRESLDDGGFAVVPDAEGRAIVGSSSPGSSTPSSATK